MHALNNNEDHDLFFDEDCHDLFNDPSNFYPPLPPSTTEKYTLTSGQVVTVSLVGHSPLWGHYLWNAGRIISRHLESHEELVHGKTVLELGAGSGLPSLICAHLKAKCVVMTDYPDPNLIENLKRNVKIFTSEINKERKTDTRNQLVVEGYRWGSDCQALLTHLPVQDEKSTGFDVLILSDLLFNHSEHNKLLDTVKQTLAKRKDAKAFVIFTPHRPWLLEKDLAFFDLAHTAGMRVEKFLEEKTEQVMFEEDRGDQELRRTVFGYIVRWNLLD